MTTASKLWFAMILASSLFLTGCDRHGPAKQEEGVQIQPGGAAEESEEVGYLGLRIVKAHENQKALDQPPWFSSGGDWTFLECEVAKEPGVRVLIGTRMRGAPKGDLPISWGESMIMVADAATGARFVEAFAKAFHQTPPPSHGKSPTLQVKMQTAVLGAGLIRDPHGGFKDGRKGTWVATKWFLQDETAETEVFFNYSIAEKRAELSEKDEEYREDLVQQLVAGLRDGPLPERTLENDPSLTAFGPTVSGWIKVASSNETCQFSHDSHALLITATEPGQSSQLFVASVAEPVKRTRLAEFAGSAFIQENISTAQGMTLLVNEMMRQKADTISSLDPQKLWLVDAKGKRQVSVPPGVTNWFASKGCLSPGARFLALGSWETQPDQKRARVIHLADLETGKWQKIGLPAALLEFVGWIGQKPAGLVLTGLAARKGEVRQAYSLDPTTGHLTPLDEVPREFAPGRILSPDGNQFAEVIGKERLVITDANTGQQREFAFHPYDRRNVYPDSVQWASDHYLVFQGARTSLINMETLKMNYPMAKESGIESAEFSPDFKLALGSKADGYYLGHVTLPNESKGNN